MAYIRSKAEELTGYQASGDYRPSVDLQCDFVMVYGLDETTVERISNYRKQGYVVHLMTGISWGKYQDYLDGEWDGRKHWEEGQKDRDGKDVIHNVTVPYMVPTVSFSEYLTEKLKTAVDAGVEAIHVEEPEFWDMSGYSEAFQREYEIYYKEPWQPPYESVEAQYRCARLKAWLYKRTIDRVSAALKEYSMVMYKKQIRFYVPTHSLLNYTQWKIISPEAELIEIPTVDGYIAQIWTGTSRQANVYEGVYRERTFETAYLEYGVMQELVKGTGRRMWFLNDPIEDLLSYTWENYEYNYRRTAVASLLHPAIWHYEICPWPHRIFEGRYPRIQPNLKIDETYETEETKDIPESYATLLSGMFQLFGNMEQKEWQYEGIQKNIGVFLSDSGMFQRTFPDSCLEGERLGERLEQVMHKNSGNPVDETAEKKLMKEIIQKGTLMNDFIQSTAFPQFYGLAMPLVKYGLPIRPVQLDNVRRFAGYLQEYNLLILSYEFMKPEGPDVNAAIVSWIRDGGTLVYVGDGSDPFHQMTSWWKKSGYENPAQHLFEMAGIVRNPEDGDYTVGTGHLMIWNMRPANICLEKDLSGVWRKKIRRAVRTQQAEWEYQNHLTLHRGPYVISAVMTESVNDKPKHLEGLYADLMENRYVILHEKEIQPDDVALLFDFSKIEGKTFYIIGTSARVLEAQDQEKGLFLKLKTADRIHAYTRLRLRRPVEHLEAYGEDKKSVDVRSEWDEESKTLLISYESTAQEVTIKADWKE